MKQLLTALLIAILVFGCEETVGDSKQKEREHDETLDVVSDWAYNKCVEYFDKGIFLSNSQGNIDSINKYNYLGKAMREVHTKILSLKYRNKKNEPTPKPSHLPDTTKPLNIKPQPRNKLDIDSIRFGDGMTSTTTISGSALFSINLNQDTTRCLLLVSDTSNQNGFRSSRCWWMEGYKLENEWHLYTMENVYLDSGKRYLKSNIIVWLSKELK